MRRTKSVENAAAFNLKEKHMVNDLPIQYRNDEVERNAYNSAFYELGFRWHWDSHTYYELLGASQDAGERICHYLQTCQPHLLKAYDAAFLVEVIQQKKAKHIERCAAPGAAASRYFDWAQAHASELGV
jgi:hypothetical protein